MNIIDVFVTKAYAASSIVGEVKSTIYDQSYGSIDTGGKGLALLITNILRIVFVVAGLLALFNFILAGFQYMTAGGDAKAMQEAWSKIWLSLVGLILIAGSFALAALFGYLIFHDPLFMLRPTIYGPNQ
jgi:hypothetical protein